jgi:putative spermidine/putrescine transport system substrate-binding protein
MSPTALAALPSAHASTHIDLNMDYWAAHRDDIANRWYAWQTK